MIRLKELRKKEGLSQQQLANKLGVTQATLSGWENEKYEIDNESLRKCAEIFNCSVDYILDIKQASLFDKEYMLKTYGVDISKSFDENMAPLKEPLNAAKKIKVLGEVPAGVPIESVESIIDEVEISDRLVNTGEQYFALLVTGDSMYPEYLDGDIVIVRKQPTADTGQDVVAYVNGYNATLKRLIKSEKGLTLRALNPAYESKTYSNQEVAELPIEIAGVVVEQRRNR